MADKLFIREDITDWRDEAYRAEMIITKDDDIFEALDQGKHTAQIARSVIVSREIEKAPEDIIKPNKALLNIAAQKEIIEKASRRKIEYRTESGKLIEAPQYVGSVSITPDEDIDEAMELEEAFVNSKSEKAYRRAESYLLNVVPGHIYSRFAIIDLNRGDLRSIAAQLKARIDHLVEAFD